MKAVGNRRKRISVGSQLDDDEDEERPAQHSAISNSSKKKRDLNDGSFISLESQTRIEEEEEEEEPSGRTTHPTRRVMFRPEPILIEEDEFVPPSSFPSSVVRPTALRVSRKDAAEFYSATETERIPHFFVHQAVQESHAWHRKYNEGAIVISSHTTPLSKLIADRNQGGGAKNPSPPSVQPMNTSLLRRRHDEETVERRARLVLPTVVKPLPLRITRPVPVRAPATFYTGDTVPKQIVLSRPMVAADVCSGDDNNDSSSCSSHVSDDNSSTNEINLCSHETTRAGSAAVHVVVPDNDGEEVSLNIENTIYYTGVRAARDDILKALATTGGETDSTNFNSSLAVLAEYYRRYGGNTDARRASQQGTWLALTKPTFFDCLGENDAGDPMYTLGRMSFDLFSPTNLLCSLQGNFNQIERVLANRNERIKTFPRALDNEVQDCNTVLRTYE